MAVSALIVNKEKDGYEKNLGIYQPGKVFALMKRNEGKNKD